MIITLFVPYWAHFDNLITSAEYMTVLYHSILAYIIHFKYLHEFSIVANSLACPLLPVGNLNPYVQGAPTENLIGCTSCNEQVSALFQKGIHSDQ